MGAIDQLPHYLQIFYRELLDTYKEIEENSTKRGRSYRFIYAKESVSLANYDRLEVLYIKQLLIFVFIIFLVFDYIYIYMHIIRCKIKRGPTSKKQNGSMRTTCLP